MTTSVIRQKLHQFIDTIEDKKAAAIYTLLAAEMGTPEQRKKLVLAENEFTKSNLTRAHQRKL